MSLLYLHLDYDPETDTTLAASVTYYPASQETFWKRAYRVCLHDLTLTGPDGSPHLVAERICTSPLAAELAVFRFTGRELPGSPLADIILAEREES